jgi:RNA polymerase sigma factor (sigma-70 family)
MLGSSYDADDAMQDAMLRAWRALGRFEGRSSLRSWLYRIATNTCLDVIAKRPKRVLPIDYGPAADPHEGPTLPLAESVWVEPYADEPLGLPEGLAAPEARYEQREAVELAFVAALQHLPANQRAALILREVLGFSAKEVAGILDTSVASVNSALQRARKTVEERMPERTQQETGRALGDEGVREVVDRYLDAWDRNDIDGVVGSRSSMSSIIEIRSGSASTRPSGHPSRWRISSRIRSLRYSSKRTNPSASSGSSGQARRCSRALMRRAISTTSCAAMSMNSWCWFGGIGKITAVTRSSSATNVLPTTATVLPT